ncbi:MAG: hypothetical protein GX148_06725 [Clostridiales bacterium]|nr:hypothetical protein [Clostridiales bacterium]
MADKNKNNDNENKIFPFLSSDKKKEGKGVTKKQAAFNGKYDFFNFFSFFKFRLGDITKISLLFALTNFSLVLMFFTLTGYTNTTITTPSTPMYQQLFGMLQYNSESATLLTYSGIFGITADISVWTVWTKILFYSGYTLLITFGLSNVGMAYLTRGFVRRENMFIWHDYWYAIKKNIKQGLIVGITDTALCYLLYYALIFYSSSRDSYYLQVFFYLTIAFAVMYFIMRMYIYYMLITFDLKIRKIFKNALIFSVLGLKRNIMAILGIAFTVFVNIYIYVFLPSVGVLLPFIFTTGLMYFITAYCVYPVIDNFMIKPYYKDQPKPKPADESVFIDRG